MKRILIVGCGSIGERHLRCFQKTGRAEVFACELDTSLRERTSEKYGCGSFENLEQALAAGNWDGVVVCTPAHLHLRHARPFLQTAIPVFIEKPLATDLDEAKNFMEEFHDRKHLVRIAYIYRSIPGIVGAKEVLEASSFGDIKHITLRSGQHFPTFRPAYRDIYYARHETGGGAIQDALTHSINAVEWVVGPTESLFCDADHQVLEGVAVEDTVNLVARHSGGAMSSLSLNQFQAPNSMELDFHAEFGSVRWDADRQRIGKIARGDSDWEWIEAKTGERDDVFTRQANMFIDHIEEKPVYLSTLDEGFQTLRVNCAALESAKSGKKIEL